MGANTVYRDIVDAKLGNNPAFTTAAFKNENSVFYINDEKKEELNIELDASVKTLTLCLGYIAITTNTSLYLIKDNKIVEGFPILSDGYFNISDIDNNGKMNVVNIKNGIIYNYELAD